MLRLIPDLDDELCHALDQVQELLLVVAMWEEDAREESVMLPEPLAGQVALGALNRIQQVVGPTQTRTGRAAPVGRLFGAGGRVEHRPLRLVALDPGDLAVLAAAATTLGMELALRPHGELARALAAGAEAAADSYGRPLAPVDLVEALARTHGLLDLAPTADSIRMTAVVAAAGVTDLVLDAGDEAAYHRTANRFIIIWAPLSDLDRFWR